MAKGAGAQRISPPARSPCTPGWTVRRARPWARLSPGISGTEAGAGPPGGGGRPATAAAAAAARLPGLYLTSTWPATTGLSRRGSGCACAHCRQEGEGYRIECQWLGGPCAAAAGQEGVAAPGGGGTAAGGSAGSPGACTDPRAAMEAQTRTKDRQRAARRYRRRCAPCERLPCRGGAASAAAHLARVILGARPPVARRAAVCS